jgi:hypothetical protein
VNTDVTASLVAAFISEKGLTESQQAMVLRLGWTSLDEFAVYAAMTTLEGES